MQQPVRYYITQTDDRPVVRSVPVTVHSREAGISAGRPEPVVERPEATEARARARVARLVRAAVRRTPA